MSVFLGNCNTVRSKVNIEELTTAVLKEKQKSVKQSYIKREKTKKKEREENDNGDKKVNIEKPIDSTETQKTRELPATKTIKTEKKTFQKKSKQKRQIQKQPEEKIQTTQRPLQIIPPKPLEKSISKEEKQKREQEKEISEDTISRNQGFAESRIHYNPLGYWITIPKSFEIDSSSPYAQYSSQSPQYWNFLEQTESSHIEFFVGITEKIQEVSEFLIQLRKEYQDRFQVEWQDIQILTPYRLEIARAHYGEQSFGVQKRSSNQEVQFAVQVLEDQDKNRLAFLLGFFSFSQMNPEEGKNLKERFKLQKEQKEQNLKVGFEDLNREKDIKDQNDQMELPAEKTEEQKEQNLKADFEGSNREKDIKDQNDQGEQPVQKTEEQQQQEKKKIFWKIYHSFAFF